MSGNGVQAAVNRAVDRTTTKPFDLDAARAARAEATQETFPFILFGQTYEVRPTDDWPLESQTALAQGDLVAAVPQLLVGGEETYKTLCRAGANVGDLTVLFQEVAKWAGMEDLGNSSGPPRPASTLT